jgi:hypothetical protein
MSQDYVPPIYPIHYKTPTSKEFIVTARWTGVLGVITGILVAGYIILMRLKDSRGYDNYVTIFDWWHWAVPLLGGIVVLVWASKRDTYWYREVVATGIITDTSFQGGEYNYYYVHVTGRNRANQVITEKIEVQPKFYFDCKIRDEYNTNKV